MSSLPDLACDCHVHVIGPRHQYPMRDDRPYTPAQATVQALGQHMGSVGVRRAVIVQPSVYGTDNRCLLDCLDAVPTVFRGIVVLDSDVDDPTLTTLSAKGVAGLRINLESTGDRDMTQTLASLRYWISRLSGSGWHIQLYAGFDLLNHVMAQLGKLPLPLVVDHFGLIPPDVTPDRLCASPLYQGLVNGDVYIKLSGAYRVGSSTDADKLTTIAHSLLSANDERLVWASDWPHTNREPGKLPTEVSRYRDIPVQQLAKERADWLTDPRVRQKVLVDNPATLYGFPKPLLA